MSQQKSRARRGACLARRCFFTPLLAERLEPRDLLALSPQLVADLNTTAAGIEVAGSMVEVGNVAYFMGRDLIHGFELWKSTGTAGGAALVKDIEPGPDGSYPTDLTNVNGTLFFSAGQGAGDFELWKSDGTAAGTVRVLDLQPGGGSSDPRGLTNVNGNLFFTASDGVTGKELWKSDGTAAGTVIVKDVNPGPAGSEAHELINRNGQLLFVANDGVNGDELWRSDGAATGTALVKDIRTGLPSSTPTTLSLLSGAAIFMAFDDTNGFGLWRSDGTTAGTTLLKDLHPGTLVNPEFRQPTNVNGTLFFATNDGVNGFELWKTDGTPAGTALVKDIAGGGDSSYPDSLANVSGVLFLQATTSSGSELWKSDGTAAGTVPVKDIRPGPDSSYPLVLTNRNGTLFFSANDGVSGYELWKSDGSGPGTMLVKDARLGPRSSYPDALLNLNGTLLFSADRGSDGAELWISDATTAGTMLSPQGDGTASSAPWQLVNVNGTVFFTAASVGGDEELWQTDPATGVVSLVKDIRPGGVGSQPAELTVVGNTLFFVADDGTTGLELWKSDGTAAGTTLVRDIQPGAVASSAVHALTNVNGVLFFIANDGINGAALWKSNGTAAGTVLVKDIVPGADEYLPSGLTNVNGRLFFSAFTAATGYELWRSDGTAAGTVLVKNIAAGAESSGPQYLTNVNGVLFFRAAEASTGLELWRSDGTSDGTVLVGDINPGAASSAPRYLTNVGGLLFFSAEHPLTGAELWRSNGFAGGTALVKDILPGAESSYLGDLIDINGTLFFTARDGARGDELWKSDGSTDGTVLVKDIVPGASASSMPRYLTNIGGVVFFAATDAAGGREIWKSDGTAAGTSQLVDVALGATPAFPGELLAVSGRLLFAASDGVRGHELWSVLLYDRGDAAASFGTTPTETGPHHLAAGPQLGLIRDEELNAAPTAQAVGDDLAGADDEDGLLATSIIRGGLSSVTLRAQTAGGGAKLDAWIDFNHDGVFAVAEKIFDSLGLAAGDSQLTFIAPASALVGPAAARFRLSTAGNLGPIGPAADGEVEDHLVTVMQDVTVNLPTGNGTDRIKIQRNGNLIEVYDAPSNVILALSLLEFTNRIVVAGSATENDEITIDYASGGFFALAGGIELDGGVGGNDTLTVLGSASATSAKYLSRGLSLGNARLQIRSGAALSEIAFVNFEPLTVSGMTTFEVEGVLDVGGQTLAITANTFVKLGTLTTLASGTFIAPSGVALAAGQVIQGAGTISGRIAAEAGSTIDATGDLTLGDLASPAGFFSRGELRVRTHTVLVLDANQAVLGSLTTLGQAGLPGTLSAPRGAVVDFGSNVFGFGTLDTPNDALQPLMNNGVIQGNSAAERIVLAGYVRGVGTLNQVTIAGTSSPGFSPAAVQFGSANFSSGGRLIAELAGESPGSGYDQVSFSGPATLGGTLKVELLGNFVPRIGSSFTVVTASSLGGNFAATVLPTLPADRKWAVSSTATEVRLAVVPADTENPWHNLANALDVDGDGFISPIDAVLIINYLNSARGNSVLNDADVGPPFLDVTGDYFIAPDDAVVVINHLNARPASAGTTAGASETSLGIVSSALLPDEIITMLALDLLSTERGRRRK